MIVFRCPRCDAEITVEEGVPKQVRCPTCLAPVAVPDSLPPVRVPGDALGDQLNDAPGDALNAPPPLAAIDATELPEAAPASLTLNEDLPTVANGDWSAQAAATAGPLEAPPALEPPRRKNPALAALLSLFPGLGHCYAGRPARGFLYLIFQSAIIVMTVVAWQRVQLETGYFGKKGLLAIGIISFLVVGLLCIYDAARAAQSRNREMLLD